MVAGTLFSVPPVSTLAFELTFNPDFLGNAVPFMPAAWWFGTAVTSAKLLYVEIG